MISSRVREYNSRFEFTSLFGSHCGIAHYDHDVAGLHKAGGGAVEAYHSRAARTGDGVGVEACAVIVVDNIHSLARQDSGSVEKVFIDGYAAYIVEPRLSDGDAVDF